MSSFQVGLNHIGKIPRHRLFSFSPIMHIKPLQEYLHKKMFVGTESLTVTCGPSTQRKGARRPQVSKRYDRVKGKLTEPTPSPCTNSCKLCGQCHKNATGKHRKDLHDKSVGQNAPETGKKNTRTTVGQKENPKRGMFFSEPQAYRPPVDPTYRYQDEFEFCSLKESSFTRQLAKRILSTCSTLLKSSLIIPRSACINSREGFISRAFHNSTRSYYLDADGHCHNTAYFSRSFSTSSKVLSKLTVAGGSEGDRGSLLAEVSQEVGNPDWGHLIRKTILLTADEDYEKVVDNVLIPFISRFFSDEKLVMENLIVLLFSTLANLSKDSKGRTEPSSRQKSIATVLMMQRLMCRVHNQMSDTWTGRVDTKLKLNVLLGDLVGVAFTRAMADLEIPQVTELLFTSASNLVSGTFLAKPTEVDEGEIESRGQDGRGKSETRDYGWEDTPVPLQCACESIALEAGLDEKLREQAGKFASHISLARFRNQEPSAISTRQNGFQEQQETSPDSQSHILTALGHLSVFPRSKNLSMLKSLAQVYASG